MKQKVVLGKGLASLLPPGRVYSSHVPGTFGEPHVAESFSNKDKHLGISMANVEEIHINPFQPRRNFEESALQELAQSIRTSGIIQPLVVRKRAQPSTGFELIAGERRLRASKLAGLQQVPIVIRRSTDKESLELALIENVQRENLNCVEEAAAYSQLIQEFNLTQEEVSERVGKDRATISNYLRLLKLPESIISDLKSQVLSFGHGKVLLGLEGSEQKIWLRNQIIQNKLSVREAEGLAMSIKNKKFEQSSVVSPSAIENNSVDHCQKISDELSQRFFSIVQELTQFLSTRVEIKGTEKKGKIVIHYSSLESLNRILDGMHS